MFIEAMIKEKNEGKNNHPMSVILQVAGLSSGAWYRKKPPESKEKKKQNRGPSPKYSDAQVLQEIRVILAESPFYGEGYKKITQRLHNRGIVVGKERVLRILRENQLLSPYRAKTNKGTKYVHDKVIVTKKLNEMWASDGKEIKTRKNGKCWLFSTIDHCNDEILGYHIVKKGDRYAAMEPIRQAVKQEFGSVAEHICSEADVLLRTDRGTQYESRDFKQEMVFLGITKSPTFVRSPESNGVIERFHRTLNEQVLFHHQFEDIEEAQEVIGTFIESYNNDWLIHRLGLMSPREYRRHLDLTEREKDVA